MHAKNQCDSGTHIVAYDSSLCLEIEQLGLVSESKRIITQEFTIKNIWTFFMECFWLSGHILQTVRFVPLSVGFVPLSVQLQSELLGYNVKMTQCS